MTEDVKYCFDDQEVEEVTRNMADIQVRRLPVLNRKSGWSAFFRSSPVGKARTLAKRCAGFRDLAESIPRRADIARLTPMVDLAHPRDRNRMVDV